MSENEKQELQKEILALENEVKRLENSTKEIIESIKERISSLKDLAWDKQSKKESSSMYKVFEINGKNVNRLLTTYSETEYEERQGRGEQGQIRREFNDRDFLRPAENIISQNQSESQGEDKEINRLLTIHSKTDVGERGQSQADKVSSATYFKDLDFRGSAYNENIAQNNTTSQGIDSFKEMNAKLDMAIENQKKSQVKAQCPQENKEQSEKLEKHRQRNTK